MLKPTALPSLPGVVVLVLAQHSRLDNNALFSPQEYFFDLVPHLLTSGDPDGGGDCHGHQPGQARTNEVFWEHLKECSEEADEEHHHVKEAERHEARVQGDKLYVLIQAV